MTDTINTASLGEKIGVKPGASFSEFRNKARSVVGRGQNGEQIDPEVIQALSKITNAVKKGHQFDALKDQAWEKVVPDLLNRKHQTTPTQKKPENPAAAAARAEAERRARAEAERRARAQAEYNARYEAEARERTRKAESEQRERDAQRAYYAQHDLMFMQQDVRKSFKTLTEALDKRDKEFRDYAQKDFDNQIKKVAPDLDAYSTGLGLLKAIQNDVLKRHARAEEVNNQKENKVNQYNDVVTAYAIFAKEFAPLLSPHFQALERNYLVSSLFRRRNDDLMGVHRMLTHVTSDEQLEVTLKELRTGLEKAPANQKERADAGIVAIDGALKVLSDYKLSQGEGAISLLNKLKGITTSNGIPIVMSNLCRSGENNTQYVRDIVNGQIRSLQSSEYASTRSALNYFEVAVSHAHSANLDGLGDFEKLSGFSNEQKHLFKEMKRLKQSYTRGDSYGFNHQTTSLATNLATAIGYSAIESLEGHVTKITADCQTQLDGIKHMPNPYKNFRESNDQLFTQVTNWLSSAPAGNASAGKIREHVDEGRTLLVALSRQIQALPPLPQGAQAQTGRQAYDQKWNF